MGAAFADFFVYTGGVSRDGVGVLDGGGVGVFARGCWLRTERARGRIAAYAGARIATAEECLLNGCHLSAKREVRVGASGRLANQAARRSRLTAAAVATFCRPALASPR